MFNILNGFWLLAPLASITALIIALLFFRKLISSSEGTPKMIEIAGYVKEGAMAYLHRQYKVVAIVFTVIFILLSVVVPLNGMT